MLALGNAASDPEGAQTPDGIARTLVLAPDDVFEALAELRRARFASIEFHDPEASEAEQDWVLTRSGIAAAAEVVAFAGRVIRWPPSVGLKN